MSFAYDDEVRGEALPEGTKSPNRLTGESVVVEQLPVARERIVGAVAPCSRLQGQRLLGSEELGAVKVAAPHDWVRPELCILVVDEVPFNRELVSAFLERFPWQVDLASDGDEAIERCRQVNYDLVLMDIQMPGTDGYEATRQIRSLERLQGRPRTPIVAFTAYGKGAEADRCLAAGCDGHLAKPITRLSLVTAVVAFARRKPSPPSPVVSAPASGADPGGASLQRDLDEEIAHLVPKYLADCALRVAELRRAAERSEFEVVKAHAHNLRGTGSSFGFPRITEWGVKIEDAIKAGDAAAIEREAAALEEYLCS